MSDLNTTAQTGRLTRDPELKSNGSGKNYCVFSMAVNEKYGDTDKTHFFDYIAWGKPAEIIFKYVKKGHKFGVSGKLAYSGWETNEGQKRSRVQIVVRDFTFLQPRAEQTTISDDQAGDRLQQEFDGKPEEMNDSDIPF